MGHYGCLPVPEAEKALAPVNVCTAENLPESVDLRTTGLLPDVFDQGQIGSCTANGSGAAYSYELARQHGGTNFIPSRLFIYYNERAANGTVNQDAGATITDATRALNQHGCPPETDWPYDVARFTEKPPAQAYTDGATREAVTVARVEQTETAIKAVLAAGFPVIIGFTVYASFEHVGVDGIVPMPQPFEQVMGGHCVLVVGYTADSWIVRNSWGAGWGDGGYCYMPLEYLTDPYLASDFWTVELVTTGITPTPAPAPKPAHRGWWARFKAWLFGLFG